MVWRCVLRPEEFSAEGGGEDVEDLGSVQHDVDRPIRTAIETHRTHTHIHKHIAQPMCTPIVQDSGSENIVYIDMYR